MSLNEWPKPTSFFPFPPSPFSCPSSKTNPQLPVEMVKIMRLTLCSRTTNHSGWPLPHRESILGPGAPFLGLVPSNPRIRAPYHPVFFLCPLVVGQYVACILEPLFACS